MIGHAQQFKIEGGLNFSTILPNTVNLTFEQEYSYRMFFNLGVKVSFPLSPIFSLETGVLFDSKGFKSSGYDYANITGQSLLYYINIDAALYYLTLPLTLQETFYLKNSSHVFVGFGPYGSIGIMGDIKYQLQDAITGRISNRENDVVWGNDDSADISRFDYGLTFQLGYEINSIQLFGAYDLGLANILPQSNSGLTSKNRSFRISLAYVLNSPKKAPIPAIK
jgi:hypothetical protein